MAGAAWVPSCPAFILHNGHRFRLEIVVKPSINLFLRTSLGDVGGGLRYYCYSPTRPKATCSFSGDPPALATVFFLDYDDVARDAKSRT
uniref:Uncharacterized protein n=1 Tax=Oryza nivara TaxID=4536 RepID=A0A0E0I7T7_ORYNI